MALYKKLNNILCLILISSVQCLALLDNSYISLDATVNAWHRNTEKVKRSEDCITTCTEDADNSLRNIAPELITLSDRVKSAPSSVVESMTKEQLKTFCQEIMQPSLKCVDQCQTSLKKTLTQKSLLSVKFVCVNHFQELYENFDCLRSTRNLTKEKCELETCSEYSVQISKLVSESQAILENNDFQRFRRLMAQNCKYMSCLAPCEKTIFEKQCGVDVTNLLLNDLLGLTMKSTKDMLILSKHETVWPPECEKILDRTGYGDNVRSEQR